MRRRDFITLLGAGATIWPPRATAQQNMRRIGVMQAIKQEDPVSQSDLGAFKERLQQLGWQDGRNIQIEYRWYAGDVRLADAQAAELVSLRLDVILAIGTAARILKKHTQTLPIVFAAVTDPVGSGLVHSLAEPGDNVTGFTTFEPSVAGKWLELLKEAAPQIGRVAAIFNPQTAPGILMPSVEAAAPRFSLELVAGAAHNSWELEQTVANFAQQPNGSLLVFPDAFAVINRALIAELAARYRLPAMYPFPSFVTSGGLMSYGVSPEHLIVRAADYIDQILKGAKPSNLPVQQPNEFKFVINVKTAKALGLNLPPTLLALADEIVE